MSSFAQRKRFPLSFIVIGHCVHESVADDAIALLVKRAAVRKICAAIFKIYARIIIIHEADIIGFNAYLILAEDIIRKIDSVAVRITCTVYENYAETPKITLVPLRLTAQTSGTDYRPVLADSDQSASIIKRILRRSSNMDGFENGSWK